MRHLYEEDRFLTLFRFLKCFYKSKCSPECKLRNKDLIKCAINKHYENKLVKGEEEAEKEANEIVYLRNHYVHEGYYINDRNLLIKTSNGKKDYVKVTGK